MILGFHPEAERELLEAAAHYESKVPGLGEALHVEVRRATELLVAHPNIGSVVDTELRAFVLRRFPFSLIYNASPDLLLIVALAHQRRRPAYWRSRARR